MIMSCNSEPEGEKGFTVKVPVLASNRITPEVLWSFGRISDESVSPDQNNVLYGVTYYDIKEDKGFKDLYVYHSKSGQTSRITNSAENKISTCWRPDGKKIGYLSERDDKAHN